MKKILSVLLLAAMVVTMASCGGAETTTAGTTTAAPTTTKGQTKAPEMTDDPNNTTPDYEADTPYLRESVEADYDLDTMLEGKTLVTDKVDVANLQSNGFSKFAETEDVPQLFDGIKTLEDFTANGGGKMGGGIASTGAYYFFPMTEQTKITAYVITTGNDSSSYPERTPVAWYIYATNDASALEDVTAFDASKWTVLDYVYDGQVAAADYMEHGYTIDADKQGDYQYYCWMVEYCGEGSTVVQACEFEFYVG